MEEEIAYSRLSLEEEINQFRFVEDMGPSEKPVDISNSKTESVNRSSVHPKQLIITQGKLGVRRGGRANGPEKETWTERPTIQQ